MLRPYLIAQLGEVGRQDRGRHNDVVLVALVHPGGGLNANSSAPGDGASTACWGLEGLHLLCCQGHCS